MSEFVCHISEINPKYLCKHPRLRSPIVLVVHDDQVWCIEDSCPHSHKEHLHRGEISVNTRGEPCVVCPKHKPRFKGGLCISFISGKADNRIGEPQGFEPATVYSVRVDHEGKVFVGPPIDPLRRNSLMGSSSPIRHKVELHKPRREPGTPLGHDKPLPRREPGTPLGHDKPLPRREPGTPLGHDKPISKCTNFDEDDDRSWSNTNNFSIGYERTVNTIFQQAHTILPRFQLQTLLSNQTNTQRRKIISELLERVQSERKVLTLENILSHRKERGIIFPGWTDITNRGTRQLIPQFGKDDQTIIPSYINNGATDRSPISTLGGINLKNISFQYNAWFRFIGRRGLLLVV